VHSASVNDWSGRVHARGGRAIASRDYSGLEIMGRVGAEVAAQVTGTGAHVQR
jgi:hypothetical protein